MARRANPAAAKSFPIFQMLHWSGHLRAAGMRYKQIPPVGCDDVKLEAVSAQTPGDPLGDPPVSRIREQPRCQAPAWGKPKSRSYRGKGDKTIS